MINKRNFIGAAAALLLMPSFAAAMDIHISGSATVASNLMQPMQAQIEAASGVNYDVVVNGSGHGLMDLVDGRSAIAMISAPLEEVVAMVNSMEPGKVDGADYTSHPVGESQVAFVVHPSNPVTHLTLAQLSDILGGKITNWSELGGPDMKIIILAEAEGGATRHVAEHRLLGGASVAGEVRVLAQVAQIPNVVKQMPPAIGIVFQKVAIDQGSAIIETDDTIRQPLFLVTRKSPTDELTRVISAAAAAGS